jgi:hypothetical protein
MKYIITLSLMLCAVIASAQQVVDVNNENKTIAFKEMMYNVGGQSAVKYVDFKDGSPYFKERWLPATLILNNGKSYEGLEAKLDIMSGCFVYKNEKGTELVAQAPIKQIVFSEGNNHFVLVNSSSMSSNGSKKIWYHQLQSGTVVLYKQLEKMIVENRPFNSATVEQSIKTTEKYFLQKGQVLIPIKKTKDILEALNDQPVVTQKFSKEKQALSEKTLVEIVSYYNSLFK